MVELSALVPDVEHLKILSDGVKYTDIYAFAARVPRLQVLSVQLANCHIPPALENAIPVSHLPVIVRISQQSCNFGKSDRFLKQTAKFFHHIWPNVRFEPHEDSKDTFEGDAVSRLNKAISRLRQDH
ncbi:hypothetical protein FRC07_014016 [Ceratobasidium sp. 392]|nr:hypothetical protein FRC07_014016 [Ceratobasidium sp. 392]